MSQQQKHIHVKMDQLPTVKCGCGNETFQQITFLKVIPGILIGSSTSELIPIPAFQCTRCKNLFDFGKYVKENSGTQSGGLQKLT